MTGILGSALGGFGGAALGSAVVTVGLDTRQLTTGMAKARKDVESGTTGMEKRSAMFGAAAITAFTLAGAAAIRFAADSIRSYQEHEQALLKLQQVIDNSPTLMGATTAAFEETATAIQNLTGYEDELVLAADTVLGRFSLTQDQINELMPLIADYARATGTDLVSAANNIGKALLGNTRALKTVGIQFTATGNTATDLGTIMDALTEKVGGTAEEFGKTTAGQAEILAAKFDDVKEVVGESLIPILDALVTVADKLVPILGFLAEHLELVAMALGTVAVYKWLPTLFMNIGMSLVNMGAVGATTGAGMMAVAEGLAAVSTAAGVAGVAVSAVYLAWKIWTGADPTFAPKLAAGLADIATNSVVVRDGLREAANELKTNFLAQVANAVEDQIPKFTAALQESTQRAKNFANMTNEEFKDFKEGAVDAIRGVVSSLDGFDRKWSITSADAAKAMRQMVAKSEEMARAYRELDRTAIPPKFRAWLTTQGPDEVQAFVGLSKRQQDKFVANWKKTDDNVEAALDSLPGKLNQQGVASADSFASGLIDTFDLKHSAVYQSAYSMAMEAVQATRDAFDSKSPSKVAKGIGQDFVLGLVEGLRSEDDKIQSAAEKTAVILTRALERQLKAAEKALDAAVDRLHNVLSQAAEFRGDIQGSFSQFMDISQAFTQMVPNPEDLTGAMIEAAPTPQSIQDWFNQQLAGANQWSSVLQALQAQGLSRDLLSQITQAGPESLGFAQALLQMGPQGIAQINAQFAELQSIAGTTARGLTQDYFGTKIDELRADVAGLRDPIKDLEAAIRALDKPRKLELVFRPGGEHALRQLILQVIAEVGLSRASL